MKARGFSLVELLVVIGTISILAALLMPALEQSLASARSVYCMNNLKQMGLSTQFYTNENRGWVIPASIWNGINNSGRDNHIQFFYLLAYLDYLPHERYTVASPHGIQFKQSNITSGGIDYPVMTGGYQKPYNPMHFCPLTKSMTAKGLSGSSGISVYLYGSRQGYFNLDSSPVIIRNTGSVISPRICEWGNIASTLPPARFIMWGDSCYWHVNSYDCAWIDQRLSYAPHGWYWSQSPYEPFSTFSGQFYLRHNDGGNAWFADGHAANITYTPTINGEFRIFSTFGPD